MKLERISKIAFLITLLPGVVVVVILLLWMLFDRYEVNNVLSFNGLLPYIAYTFIMLFLIVVCVYGLIKKKKNMLQIVCRLLFLLLTIGYFIFIETQNSFLG